MHNVKAMLLYHRSTYIKLGHDGGLYFVFNIPYIQADFFYLTWSEPEAILALPRSDCW